MCGLIARLGAVATAKAQFPTWGIALFLLLHAFVWNKYVFFFRKMDYVANTYLFGLRLYSDIRSAFVIK